MNDNKVSEKAVWDNYIPSDNENFTPSASQMHTQPQMMFCYECNNVIPGDSVYCPYCQVKLFTECPKCGAKYSSQYPSCSQCGTNREDYLRIQRREQQRLESIELEKRRQREIAERKRLEEEHRRKEVEEERKRQENLQRWRAQDAIRIEKEFIKRTQEFNSAYDYLCELNKRKEEHNKAQDKKVYGRLKIIAIFWIIGVIFMNYLPDFISFIAMTSPLWCLFFLGSKNHIHEIKGLQKFCPQTRNFNSNLTQEIVNRVSVYIAKQNINLDSTFAKEHFEEEIIKAYKAAGGPIR